MISHCLNQWWLAYWGIYAYLAHNDFKCQFRIHKGPKLCRHFTCRYPNKKGQNNKHLKILVSLSNEINHHCISTPIITTGTSSTSVLLQTLSYLVNPMFLRGSVAILRRHTYMSARAVKTNTWCYLWGKFSQTVVICNNQFFLKKLPATFLRDFLRFCLHIKWCYLVKKVIWNHW